MSSVSWDFVQDLICASFSYIIKIRVFFFLVDKMECVITQLSKLSVYCTNLVDLAAELFETSYLIRFCFFYETSSEMEREG